MKNYHIVLSALLFGFVVGVAAPVHAADYQSDTVQNIDTDTCSVTTNNATFDFDDCDDVGDFEEGDQITVIHNQGLVLLRSMAGDEFFVAEE